MIANPGHGITLGGLSLMADGDSVVHDGGFTTEVSADGTTWGNPEVVISTLISQLTDGDLVTQTRAGNRQPVLYVRIAADTHAGLIAGDTALSAVVGTPCELTWQPFDPLAPLTVIDVVHSRMDHTWDDMDERRRRRTWVVTMSALPWPRSATQVVTPAVATGATTVVNAGTATTGWTAANSPPGATVTVASGAIVNTYAAGASGAGLRLAGPVDVSTTKYIAVDWKTSVPAFHGFWVDDSGIQITEVRREPAPVATFTRSWYQVDDAATSIASLTFVVVHTATTATATLSIDQVIKASTLPVTGTARQLSRTIDPDGNIPAEGTIKVQHATEGLGQVIVFSHPAEGGYSPALRQWRISGDTPTPDTGVVSGAFNTLVAATGYRAPITSVPVGDVQLWARLARSGSTGAVRIFWAAESWVGSSVVGDQQAGSTVVDFPVSDAWYMVPLGRMTSPPAKVGPAGFFQMGIQRDSSSSANIIIDEAWLFAMDKGRLTVVDCGTGTPTIGSIANRLRVAAPSLDAPFGAIEVATAADFSDSYVATSTKVMCDQTGHRFDPNGSVIYAVTSGPATEASVSFEHYARWRAEAGS